MESCLRISDNKSVKAFLCIAVIFCVLFLTPKAYAKYSHGPRQTGEEVLIELLMGPGKFIISVGSSGCTGKGFFKVDIKKEEGLTPKVPHYVLTVNRIKPDECKAIVDDGTLILFDLEKDFGIKGDFTYSLTNRVYATSRVKMWDDSLLEAIEKHFKLPEVKDIKPGFEEEEK